MRLIEIFLASTLLTAFARGAQPSVTEPTRVAIYHSLVINKVLQPGRQLAHLSLTCSLTIDNSKYSVIDVQELIKGAREPRGLNRLVLLDEALRPTRVIEYIDRRPLFCDANRLYLFGDLSIDNIGPEGNVLTFSRAGKGVKASHVEANEVPAPIIRDADHPPQ